MDIQNTFLAKTKELKQLKSQLQVLEKQTELLQKKYNKFILHSKIEEIESEYEPLIGGLNTLTIRNLLTKDNDALSINLVNVPIVTVGSGPWSEEEFDQFLVGKDFSLYELPSTKIDILILGKSDVDAESLIEQIDLALNETPNLKIYTQELFVCWLITGIDPIEDWSEDDLLESVSDHFILNYLFDNYSSFQWPYFAESNVSVWGDVEEIDSSEWQSESVLHRLGYSVTDGKLSVSERRKCLNDAFTKDLSFLSLDKTSYRKWGVPRSSQRLYAMANLIAWLSGFQGVHKPLAKQKWMEDLSWLKEHYFDKRMAFKWPYLHKAPNLPKTPTRTVLKPAKEWPFPTGFRP
jgi:hypothetical protein